MYTIKENNKKQITGIHAIKDNVVKTVTRVYAVVQNTVVLVWTLAQDVISSVFSAGYWMNNEGWDNNDSWKND